MLKPRGNKMVLVALVMALFFMALLPVVALSQQSRPSSGGTLRIAVERDQTRFMDARYLSIPGQYPSAFTIYEFLVGYGPKGLQELVPGLLESWRQVDPITYLFYIRKGVKFHNGREMTAEDVKENLDWSLKTPEGWAPVSRRAYLARVMDKVEIVDRYTLRVRLKVPFALLIPTLRMVYQGIALPEEVRKWGKDFTLHPSGTGPFKFIEVVPGDRVILERFEGYWGKRPYLDRVVVRSIPDEQARLVAVQTGEVDVARLDLTSLPAVRKDPNLKAVEVPSLGTTMGVWFNTRKWPMSSLKFRRAIWMGAEWHKFASAIYGGIPGRTPLERSWAENPKAKELVPYYDPDKARRLLKEVEAEAGRAIPPLIFLTPIPYIQVQVGTLAKSQLKKIGVEVMVDAKEAVVPARRTLKWDMGSGASPGPGSDPFFLLSYFSTEGEGDMPDGKNLMGYANPRIDELLKRAAMTDDRSQRAKIYQEIEEILLKDVPGFYLYTFITVWTTNKKVRDAGFLTDGAIYLTTPWNNTWMDR